MDATAFVDPDYSMPGAPKVLRIDNKQRFPNLTLHCLQWADHSRRKAHGSWDSGYRETVISWVRAIRMNYPEQEILVISSKDMKEAVLSAMSGFQGVHINHFGNLKGSNEYRNCRHVVFIHFLRWNTPSYLLRAYWLSESGNIPGVKKGFTPVMNGVLKNKGRLSGGTEFSETDLEMLRLQYDTADVIQTIMRTALRQSTENEVHVWLPGQNLRRIGMLLEYFVGAKVETFEQVKK
jgi:hypothetical protein